MVTYSTAIILGLVCLVIGFVIGMGFSIFTGGQSKTPPTGGYSAPPASHPAAPRETRTGDETAIKGTITATPQPLTRKLPAAEAAPVQSFSIVAQINDVLQRKMENSPLEDRKIRLTEDPVSGGVMVWIGLEHYNGIDNVPDKKVRKVIQEAVAAWERQMENRF